MIAATILAAIVLLAATPASANPADISPAPAQGIQQSAAMDRWMSFQLEGTHLYAGISLAPGVSMGLDYDSGATSDSAGGFAFAFRFGALFGRTELGIEISPVATVVDFDARANFTLNGHVGYLVPLTQNLYWPLRFGVGFLAVNTARADALFQARADLIGLGYKLGHVLVEANLPTFRFTTDFDAGAVMTWGFNFSASYVF